MGKAQHPPQAVRGIIFDLDGTLVDSARLTTAIINAMLADRGISDCADPAVVRAMDAVGGAAMIAAVMGRHCRDPHAEIAEFRARHQLVATPADLAFPGVAMALAELAAARVPMAICSNKPQPLCDRILADLGLARQFAAIIGARPDLPRKPAPEGVRLALAALGLPAADCLYVGDSHVDVATAAAAGLPVALVAWGYGLSAARAAAPFAPVLDHPSLLPAMVRQQPGG